MEVDNTNQSVSTSPSTVQNSTPEHPVKNHKSKILIVLGVLILLIVGAGAYYLSTQKNQPNNVSQQMYTNTPTTQTTPTQPSKSEWKTYQNNKYDFSFTYPSEWKFEEIPSTGYPDEQLKNGTDINFGPMDDKDHLGKPVKPFINSRITFHVYSTPSATIENLLANYSGKPVIRKETFNTNPVTIVEHSGGLAGGYDVLFKHKNTLIIIEAGNAEYGSDTELYGKGVLEKMLSTFKITGEEKEK